uniref:Uncharacterized protein n=1 Tax=Manihot esculenta TaxID=3983 RepID=A0A2C9W8W3_MANES
MFEAVCCFIFILCFSFCTANSISCLSFGLDMCLFFNLHLSSWW